MAKNEIPLHPLPMLPGRLGRPRTIETPELFDALVDQYVMECNERRVPVSVTGMCLALGFNHRGGLYDYAARPGFEGFSDSVKRARMIVEHQYEMLALNGGGAGPIFLLKASYGYVDRQVVDVNATGEITVVMSEKDAQL